MKKKVFNCDKLSLYDKASAILYLSLTIMTASIDFWLINAETQKTFVMAYSFLTPFFIYVFSYKSLRNLKMVMIWVAFAIVHLPLYDYLIGNKDLLFVRGSHAAHGLQYTIIFILLFQVLRITHLKIFGYELVSLSRGSTTDLWDERKIRFPDVVCFFIYIPIWLLIQHSNG